MEVKGLKKIIQATHFQGLLFFLLALINIGFHFQSEKVKTPASITPKNVICATAQFKDSTPLNRTYFLSSVNSIGCSFSSQFKKQSKPVPFMATSLDLLLIQDTKLINTAQNEIWVPQPSSCYFSRGPPRVTKIIVYS